MRPGWSDEPLLRQSGCNGAERRRASSVHWCAVAVQAQPFLIACTLGIGLPALTLSSLASHAVRREHGNHPAGRGALVVSADGSPRGLMLSMSAANYDVHRRRVGEHGPGALRLQQQA